GAASRRSMRRRAVFSLRLRLSAPPLDRLVKQRGQVDHLHLRAGVAHAVVEHDGTERAGDGKGVGAGLGRLSDALLVDGPAAALLHPHARAARAAAERTPSVTT